MNLWINVLSGKEICDFEIETALKLQVMAGGATVVFTRKGWCGLEESLPVAGRLSAGGERSFPPCFSDESASDSSWALRQQLD